MDFYFLLFILILAVLYSSVGHGGASGYLAMMAIFGMSTEIMRPSALTLNIFVSAIAFYSFYKNGHFKIKLLIPFIITSIPFAFIGGLLSVDPKIYKIILGCFLMIAILRMVVKPVSKTNNTKDINLKFAILIGAFLGFFSGIIGIGGGIILSPILILLGWANVKETSAISAAFIFINSVAGFTGLAVQGSSFDPNIALMIVAGLVGGLLGSILGSFRFSESALRYALSVVLVFASIKLIFL